jgi:hypothetical protein
VKVNSVLDIFGALIVLSALALVIRHPQIVTSVGSAFNTALKTAKS